MWYNELEAKIDEGYDALRLAIVTQACDDYFVCKRALEGLTGDGEKHPAWGHISNTQKTLDEVIEFFGSAWFRQLMHDNELAYNHTGIIEGLDRIVHDFDTYPSMNPPFRSTKGKSTNRYTEMI